MDVIDNEPRLWWGVEIHEELVPLIDHGDAKAMMAPFLGCLGELEVELHRGEAAWELRWSLPRSVADGVQADTLLGVARVVASRMDAALPVATPRLPDWQAREMVALSPAVVVCSLALPGVARNALAGLGIGTAPAAMAAGLTEAEIAGPGGLLHRLGASRGTIDARHTGGVGYVRPLLLGNGRLHHLLANYLLGPDTHERQLELVAGAVRILDGLDENPEQSESSLAEMLDCLSDALRLIGRARHGWTTAHYGPLDEDDTEDDAPMPLGDSL